MISNYYWYIGSQEQTAMARPMIYVVFHTKSLQIPVQVKPSPVYPGLHAQLKVPGEFVQVAFESQLFRVELEHSSISNKIK